MYAANGVSAYFVYSVGPATPLIADDLGISLQSAALHGSAMAAALLTAGAISSPIIRRLGRLPAIAMSMSVMGAGVVLVLIAPMLAVSLLGAFLAGTGGAVTAVAANATLADEHPDLAPAVLTEANATAGWVGLFAPLLMGVFLSIGLGWRVGLAMALPMCAGMAVGAMALRRRRRETASTAAADAARAAEQAAVERAAHGGDLDVAVAAPLGGESLVVPRESHQLSHEPAIPEPLELADDDPVPAAPDPALARRVPGAFWIVMAAVAAAAGAEFAVNYWGATLLRENTGSSVGAVTAVMSAPVAGIAVGRTLGARLALRLSAHSMLVGGWAVALVGFLVFWRAGLLPLAALGLFITGLGLSVIYPLLLDRIVLFLPHRKDWGLAVGYAFVGAAIGLAPYGLGALAGVVGVAPAFLVVPSLMAIGLVAVLASRPQPAASSPT